MSDDPDVRFLRRLFVWFMLSMASALGFLLGAIAVTTGVPVAWYSVIMAVAFVAFGLIVRR